MSVDDINNFSTQRRNVIFVSAILLTKQYLEIDYSEFDLFGSGLKIGNPDGIQIVLWVLWGYFF